MQPRMAVNPTKTLLLFGETRTQGPATGTKKGCHTPHDMEKKQCTPTNMDETRRTTYGEAHGEVEREE